MVVDLSKAKIFPASRDYGHAESGKRAYGDSTGRDEGRPLQRKRVFVLQPPQERVESSVLGQKRFLAKPEAAGKGHLPLASGRRASAGADGGAAADVVSRDRFFQSA